MFTILMWSIFGLVVGLVAKAIHPGDDPIGCLPTIGIGVAGSFVGGGINWLIGMGPITPGNTFHPAGMFLSILGGVLCCAGWRWYNLKTAETGPKSFFSGKNLK